ncbi:hypothetical protein Agub_g2777 [Astrephomene gubernaculifera]|uniref:Uncharacterized protein n=1 Tax=Astrephomene gubernaculifera TaxID=47775 RepID=A0AAD3HIN1_9CHLO|nr:hypothetical protein Agub_g2777 [Astrephomene gubernaculifera]
MLLALASYPRPLSHTTSYEYAVIFLGAAFGGLLSTSNLLNTAPALLQYLTTTPHPTTPPQLLAQLLGGDPASSTITPSVSSSSSASASFFSSLLRFQTSASAAATAPSSSFSSSSSSSATESTSLPPLLQLLLQLLPRPLLVLLLGFLLVSAIKEGSKALLLALLPRLLALAPPGLRRAWQPPVHPEGCWRGAQTGGEEGQKAGGARRAVTAVVAEAVSADGKEEEKEGQGGASPLAARAAAVERKAQALAAAGVLMKSPKLPYDVDFVRKFVNYGITVYAAAEFRFLAAWLLSLPSSGADGTY